jgi:hypothetical protein
MEHGWLKGGNFLHFAELRLSFATEHRVHELRVVLYAEDSIISRQVTGQHWLLLMMDYLLRKNVVRTGEVRFKGTLSLHDTGPNIYQK